MVLSLVDLFFHRYAGQNGLAARNLLSFGGHRALTTNNERGTILMGMQPTTGNSQGENPASVQGTPTGGSTAGTGNPTAPTQGANPSVSQGDTGVSKEAFDALTAKLSALESDNKKYRDRLRAIVNDDEEDSGSSKQTGKSDKAATEALELMRELRQERALNVLSSAAAKANFLYPDTVLNYVDLDEITDKKGVVKEPDKVIAGLRTKYPKLFGGTVDGSADAGAGVASTGPNTTDMNALIRARSRRT